MTPTPELPHPDIPPRGESPLPRINADPARAPSRVEIEWLCTSPHVVIGPEPRTVALIRGRFGDVQVRSIRVQFPLVLPDDFHASIAMYRSAELVAKRGIVVATLQGKHRATCHCDLPPVSAAEMIDPVWVHQFLRTMPQSAKADYAMICGVRREWAATPHQGLALVVQANYRVVVKSMIGGV